MKTEIDISAYLNSHGKKPRGEGLWIFGLENPIYSRDGINRMFSGTYSEAKEKAIGSFGGPVVLYLYP